MIIARAREKDNIAEYILYMWQIEDLIRAANFDLEYINRTVITKFDLPPKVLAEMREWYKKLINNMLSEGLRTRGHLSFLLNLMDRLGNIHLELMENDEEIRYHELYHLARNNISEFMIRSGRTYNSEIEACFNGLYAYILLRLQKKEISADTSQAMTTFSNLLAGLSARYHKRLKADNNPSS
jgi:SAM-dependent methyltransferase